MRGYIVSKNGKTLIRRWSMMNPEIDYVVIVDEAVEDEAVEIIDRNADAWWDDDQGLGYCEGFEIEFTEKGISYECYALQDFLADLAISVEVDEEDWELFVLSLLKAL